VLLGIATFDHDSFRQVVLDERFSPAADAKGLPTVHLIDAIGDVVEVAERGGGLIIGWSHHEEEVVRTLCPAPLADRFSARYVSAIRTAAKWRRAMGVARFPDGERLSWYLRLAGVKVAPAHGPGRTGNTLAILGDAFGSGRAYDAITARRRARWAALLGHNRIDVMGMISVVDLATRPSAGLAGLTIGANASHRVP
jgi:hypothetical protein